MENIKQIQLPDIFSKGFINDQADIKIPYQMAQSVQNIRLANKVSIPRKGYATKINMGTASGIKGIGTYNKKLVFTYNGHIYLTDEAVGLTTDLGVLNTGVNTKDYGPSITAYGSKLMIFNGGIPQVWDGATLSNITTIDAGYLPNVAEIFKNSQWISNGTSVYVRSQPATAANPEYIYIFDSLADSPQVVETANIVALKSTLQSLYIFTETEILEFQNSYGSTGYPIVNKISEGSSPWSNNSITSANNTIFFLTKENKIKTINLVPGIPNSQVGELSNIKDNSIQGYIDDNLHADQHLATCQRYDLDSLVKFNVRSKTASTNDLVLIYDLKNSTWLLDTEKNFGTNGININGKTYVGSATTGKIYQDEVGKTDDTAAITVKRKTKLFDFGNPTIRKALREMKVSGSINLDTSIQLTCEVDTEVVKTEYLDKYLVSNDVVGIKSVNVKYPFRKVFSRGDLYEKGYTFAFEFIATGTNLDFTLEYMDTGMAVVGEGAQNELFEK